MTSADDYCDFCELPLSQCQHGRPAPPPPPKPAPKPPAAPRKRATKAPAPGSTSKPVIRRWTSPEDFKPLILDVLHEAGGELDGEEALARLEDLAGDRLLTGDREPTPDGELRWRYAARRARMALVTEGLMKKSRPGVWELA